VTLFIILMILALPAWSGAETVTLEEAMTRAVRDRPFAQAARQEAKAATAAVGEARSGFLPRAILSENFTWTDEPAGSLFISLNQEDLILAQDADSYNFPPSRKDFETRLTLRQTLFDTDVYYGWRQAGKRALAGTYDACRSSEEAAFAAFKAYLRVQHARAAIDWVNSSLREAKEILRLTNEKYEAGVGLKADVLRSRVFFSEAQRRQVTAENELYIARRYLALAIGNPAMEVEIAEPVAIDFLDRDLSSSPELRRSDLRALSFREEAASLAHRESRAAYLPKLGLSGSYALHDGEVPFGTEAASWTIGANLSWEIFDGFRRHHTSARTEALERAAEARRREAWEQAIVAVEEARRRADETQINLATVRESVKEAEESFRLRNQRFEAGLADLSDSLDAQTALDRARHERILAETKYFLALGNIHFEKGTFLETMLPFLSACEGE